MFEEQKSPAQSASSLGEFKLIDELTKSFEIQQKSSVKGIGDDAAILEPVHEQILVSTDLLIEGVHFNLGYMPLKHLGYKAVTVNLSDICAMNAIPTQITLGIAVSNRFTLEALKEFYAGVETACRAYGVDLVGGDTTSSTKGMMISVTAIGSVEKGKACRRDGAKEGDLIVVSGDLGAAYLGFQILERERKVFEVNEQHQPDLDLYAYLVERQLKPEARKDVVELLKQLEVNPSSMIDISDGLASEIKHLCKESDLGCKIYEDKIPIDPTVVRTAEEFKLDPSLCALSGGEDYELLFSIPQEDYPKIKANPNLSVIGHFTGPNTGCYLVGRDDSMAEITAQGWDSFRE